MPSIVVGGPKCDVDQKRKLAEKLTDVAAEIYRLPKEAITVVIQESPPENVGIGGVLLVDRKH
ncbi:4-oxalocrotonate tautomerase DmpI [Chloroflexota bacterium]